MGRGWAGQGLPRSARRCPVRTVTPGQRHHPVVSASAVAPLQWRAGGACRAVGLGLGQTPHLWGRGCRGLGAGQGLTIKER